MHDATIERGRRSIGELRRASIGATFGRLAGRQAGRNQVTRMPTSIETTIVRGSTTVPPAGKSTPKPASTARSPCAVPMPATTPTPMRTRR